MDKSEVLLNKLLRYRRQHNQEKALKPEVLDDFLSVGWYRIGQRLFAVDYIYLDENWIRVFWMRMVLNNFQFGKQQKEVIKKNSGFSLEIKPLKLGEEHENLYSLYRESINFEGAPSASDFLFNQSANQGLICEIFPSRMIEMRDGKKLIAIGVFDLGKKTISGILNYFDPAYKKYSPGKFMMLKKIELGIQLGCHYYYPGYVADGYSKFDYKFWPGKEYSELYNPVFETWIPFEPNLVRTLAGDQEELLQFLGPRSIEVDLELNMVFP